MKTTVLICAMEKECYFILKNMTVTDIYENSPYKIYSGLLFGKPIKLMICGVGSTSSAFAITLIKDAELIINFGCAGAHTTDLKSGDFILASGIVGGIGFTEDFRLIYKRIETDANSVKMFSNAFSKENIDYRVGDVFSADVWHSKEEIPAFCKKYETLCEDMESYSICFSANKLGIPTAIIKFISNNELVGEKFSLKSFEQTQAKFLNVLKSIL